MDSIAFIKQRFETAESSLIEELIQTYQNDGRKGVQNLIARAQRNVQRLQNEQARVRALYTFEETLIAQAGGTLAVGLDEVGRGCVAGPLAVGAVVLHKNAPLLEGLNDSKQISPEVRKALAEKIKQCALAWNVSFVSAHTIDECGMSACLRRAFSSALSAVEKAGVTPDVVLLDGNPLGIHPHEVNVIKGDAKCASIAAASIVAKVERDTYMESLSKSFLEYGFESHKGYGTEAHIQAIQKYGLSTVHRKSFCTKFFQDSLF